MNFFSYNEVLVKNENFCILYFNPMSITGPQQLVKYWGIMLLMTVYHNVENQLSSEVIDISIQLNFDTSNTDIPYTMDM